MAETSPTRRPDTPTTTDVVVVGAGPAGAAAAITLARAGMEVVVIDKATFPRDKICGDGITTGALRHLEELGLDPAAVPSWMPVQDVYVRSPSGVEVCFPLPRDRGLFAAIAERRDLDAALVELARKEGATILEGHALIDATEDAAGITVTAEGLEPIRASWAIGADGMWSPLRKALGVAAPGYRGEWHAFRQYISNVGPRASQEILVAFEADLLPGYLWSFPLPDGRANIGFGIQRGSTPSGVPVRTKDMSRMWRDLLERPFVREFLGPDWEAEEPHRAWPIPAAVGSLPAATGRALFAGDALAVCDVMTGEGIGQALYSGRLAAETIRDAGRRGMEVPTRYTRRIHEEFAADHAMSELLVRALKHRKGARAAIRVAGATPWTRRNFARWLFEDYPRAVVATPRRWHRGMFTGPGTYR